MNEMLRNQIKQLQDVNLRETYLVLRLGIAELHRLSYD
jgi:hypothetical protein